MGCTLALLLGMEVESSLAVGVDSVLHPVFGVDLAHSTGPVEEPMLMCLEMLVWALDLVPLFLLAGYLEKLLSSRPDSWNREVAECSELVGNL